MIDGLGGIHKHLLHCDHFYTLLVLLLQYSFASSGGKKKKKKCLLVFKFIKATSRATSHCFAAVYFNSCLIVLLKMSDAV